MVRTAHHFMKQKEKEEYFAGAALNGTGRYRRWISFDLVSQVQICIPMIFIQLPKEIWPTEKLYIQKDIHVPPAVLTQPNHPPHTHSDS